MDENLPEAYKKAREQIQTLNPNIVSLQLDPDRGSDQFGWQALGMPWVEGAVKRAFPDADVYPMFATAALYGAYLDEFDRWRSAFRLDVPRSFQGVLIKDKGFASSWIPMVNSGLAGLYGRPYDTRSVSLICLDNFLVRLACSSLYELIVNCAAPAVGSLERFRKSDAHPLLTYQRFVSLQPPNASEVEALDRSREAFLEASKALAAGRHQHDLIREMPMLLPHAYGADPFAMRFRRYCESMVIHFQMGHEFGHYCFHEGNDPRFDQLHELVRKLVAASQEPVGNDTVEEVFCDMMGLENCRFQQQHFVVPQQFAVFASLWMIELIGQLVATEERASEYPQTLWGQLRMRSRAMRAWWTLVADSNSDPALLSVLKHADRAVRAPAKVVSGRLQRRPDETAKDEFQAVEQSASTTRQDSMPPLDLDELMRSGIDKGNNGDLASAIDDFTSILGSPWIPVQTLGIAYLNRGITKLSLADETGAIEDFRNAIERGAGNAVAKAYLARASVRRKLGDAAGACFDCTAAGLAVKRQDVMS